MTIFRWIAYPLLFLFASVAPLLVDGGDISWVRATHRGDLMAFSVLGCTMSLALMLVAVIEWRLVGRRNPMCEEIRAVGIGLLVAFALLAQVVEVSERSGDYRCYEAAAQALERGANPYDGTQYLYPPLLAQSLEWLGHRADDIRAHSIRYDDPSIGWNGKTRAAWVYYLYRCAMLGAALLAYVATVAFALRVRFSLTQASVGAALLFVVNTAMFRTFRYDQVNIFVLAVSLGAVLVAGRRPILAGGLIATGAHLKVMPLALGLPLLLAGNFRALIAAGVWLALGGLASAGWGSDWAVWGQYREFADSFPHQRFLRDNSVFGALYHSLLVLGGGRIPEPTAFASAETLLRFLTPVLFLAMVGRVMLRERDLRARPAEERGALGDWAFLGHGGDMLALSLVIAPIAWPHHYVMAIPFSLFVLATARPERRALVGFFVALMLLPPTFDVYPWSYHRLVALVVLLGLSWPRGQTGFARWRIA